MIAFLYGFFFIKESQTELEPQNKSKKSFLADFFDPSNAIETFKIFTRKDLKLQVSILLIVVMVVVGPMHGEQAVLYLYTRLKFNWNHIDYSVYSTYATLMTMGGKKIVELKLKFFFKFFKFLIFLKKLIFDFNFVN